MDKRSFRIILACTLLQMALAADACWYGTYSPQEYYTCHIPPVEDTKKETMVELWHRTLLPNVDTKEIAKLLFPEGGYTLEQIQNLDVSPVLRRCLTANNNALLEYVCTMRQVNDRRAQMSNPWYYYYAGEPKSAELNRLADICLARLDTRYGDRYALLAARALNTLKRYPELDDLARNHKFKDKDVEAIFRPQYAGSLFNLGRYEDAARIYAKAGDLSSLKMCMQKLGLYQDGLSVISRLADYESNYNTVVNQLSCYIHSMENENYYGDLCESNPTDVPTAVASLIETAHTLSAKPDKYQPVWRYAEAMGWLIHGNDFAKADSVLTLVDTRKVDPEFRKSFRALRFITQSRLKPTDEKYLPWVVSEAEWLIRQSDLERVEGGPRANFECNITFSRNNHYSTLYFSDMLHKAVDVIIAPRLLEHGDTLAVLQLLDIVDHANLSHSEVRDTDSHGNASACFAMECGADLLIEALARNENPRTSLDRLWKKIGSIRITDRWLDLTGTALLAEGRYKDALKYLQLVSPDYAKLRNIYDNKSKNPFAVELRADFQCHQPNVKMNTPGYFKLWFARQMSQLEDTMNNPSLSSEQRAEAKLKYGVGMANSVFPCWPLTRYGDGSSPFFPWKNPSDHSIRLDSREIAHNLISDNYCDAYDPYVDATPFAHSFARLSQLRIKGEEHIADALSQIKNFETLAAYHRSMGHYQTIKHRYPNTSVAQDLRSHCDRWSMY